jgi:hypothetical protein
MSGGSSGNTQTSSTTAAPYKASIPLLDQGMGDAKKLYDAGQLVKPNTMSTVVPFSQDTMSGISGLQGLAGANSGGQGLSGQYQGIIDAGGFNAPQQTAMQGIQNTATQDFNIDENPAYAGIRQRAMDAASNAVNSQAAGMGRFGAPTHQGTLAREVGNVAGNLDFQQFQNHQNRQSAAQQQLFNAGQTGMGNLGSAYEGAQAPSQTQMQTGGMFEDLMGRQLNDQLRISNELTGLPLANIQALLGVASGAGNYGKTTQTAQGPSSGLSNMLGMGLGGLSLLGGL